MVHSQEDLDSIELADSCGFSNLNADLMYGLPGQHLSDLLSAIYRMGIREIEEIFLTSPIAKINW